MAFRLVSISCFPVQISASQIEVITNPLASGAFSPKIRVSSPIIQSPKPSQTFIISHALSNPHSDGEAEEEANLVEDIRVPENWMLPSKALEESEWLRESLHKWLDEEYCPEATNVEISRVAASSYYECLIEKQSEIGEILLKMIRALETLSYQDSFHGAFSAANAAVNLIIERIRRNPIFLVWESEVVGDGFGHYITREGP
ncbi:hypothetical protein RJ641_030437 [Dillenia turbinata]|uniref:Uncharacterized protein n=1 Tax=Dillenia turbinata TaxID=194707 RepID=A0AAN8ZK66_9MAGN